MPLSLLPPSAMSRHSNGQNRSKIHKGGKCVVYFLAHSLKKISMALTFLCVEYAVKAKKLLA